MWVLSWSKVRTFPSKRGGSWDGSRGRTRGLGLETHVGMNPQKLLICLETKLETVNGSRRGEAGGGAFCLPLTCEVGEVRGCGTLQGSEETSGCGAGRARGPALTARWNDLKEEGWTVRSEKEEHAAEEGTGDQAEFLNRIKRPGGEPDAGD